jgi:hypothetical protein
VTLEAADGVERHRSPDRRRDRRRAFRYRLDRLAAEEQAENTVTVPVLDC